MSAPYTRPVGDPDTAPSLEQWARTEALYAIMINGTTADPRAVAVKVNAYAHLILTGELPAREPGTYW